MRAFLAIPLPETVRRAAAAYRDLLSTRGKEWRFVRDEGLHVTVRFLGLLDPSQRTACDAAWRDAASGVRPFPLRVRGGLVFPSKGRPRVLSLGVDDESGDGSLARLALRMELAARAQGFAPEARPFSGHVTIARARNATRVSRPDVSGIGDCGAFIADRVVLYRSELGPGGSRYFEEGVFPLPPGRVD